MTNGENISKEVEDIAETIRTMTLTQEEALKILESITYLQSRLVERLVEIKE